VMWVACATGASAALWSSPARGWVANAEAFMTAGAQAEKEGNSLVAYSHYRQAQELLRRSITERPTFRPEFVRAKDAECQARLSFLESRARNMAEGVPVRETEWVEEAPVAVARPAVGTESAPERPRPPQQQAVDASREHPTGEDVVLSREIQALLAEGRGAEAVLRLENVIEESKDKATLTQHLLLAQALMTRRNYGRAEAILLPLSEQFRDNPSVLLMASGIAVVKGEPMVAMRMLDSVLQEHPTFADAWVNLAYLRLAMDPRENRQEAIAYYQEALRLGAVRDRRLEQELNITVQEKEFKQ